MYKKITLILMAFFFFISIQPFSIVSAKGNQGEKAAEAFIPDLQNVITNLKQDNFSMANKSFTDFKNEVVKVKNEIRSDSPESYTAIETKIAQLSLALLNEDRTKSIEQAETLLATVTAYSKGTLQTNPNKIEKKSLATYITQLKQTKESIEKQDIASAKLQAEQLKMDWLGVEGDVVSQSQSVYNHAEKSLVLIEAYLKDPNKISKASKAIDEMITQLEPLQNNSYGIWDAAFIPIREGVEALLVVGALLAVTNKSKARNGTRWIWGGTLLGLLTSIVIGIIVSYFLTTISFGQNNFIINGFSGIIASIMLLYVSYWLHRNSNVKQWNSFVKQKTETALSSGKMFSLATLAFLAILREGMETVIFLIGMVNKMSMETFLTGILVGFGILIILGIFILKLGSFIPLKPFFFVSSIIVFYLCIKFMGTGLHSLQLAGIIDSTVTEKIPTISFLGVFPSWYSTLPQIIIISIAILFVLGKRFINKQSLQNIGGKFS
ncbi:MAG: FTR1 family protein [Bacillaceae bacterium]